MKDFLRRAVTENAALKAVALILAVTLFILVRGDRETERQVRVAVAYVKPDGARIVGDLPPVIEVRVRGPWTRIKRLDPASIDTVLVDLSQAKEGDFPIDESLIALPPGVRVATIKPNKIAVEFEREKEVPIVATFSGAPPEGFKVDKDETALVPPRVRLHGPRSRLDPILFVETAPIDVGERSDTFEHEVALAPLPQGIAFVGAPVVSVDVKVKIIAVSETRPLGRLPVRVRPRAGSAGTERLTATVDPDLVDVVLYGRPGAFAKFHPRDAVAIVELETEDAQTLRPRSAKVAIEGIPENVVIEVHPPAVEITPVAPGNRPARNP